MCVHVVAPHLQQRLGRRSGWCLSNTARPSFGLVPVGRLPGYSTCLSRLLKVFAG